MGQPSRRTTSIIAWCIAATGTVIILGSAFIPGVAVPALIAGTALVVLGAVIFAVGLLRSGRDTGRSDSGN